jgi:hypothetical protein
MASATGLGAAVGALVTAGRGRIRLRALTIGAAAFELLILAAAAAPSLPIELLVLALVGPGQRVVPRRWATPLSSSQRCRRCVVG